MNTNEKPGELSSNNIISENNMLSLIVLLQQKNLVK